MDNKMLTDLARQLGFPEDEAAGKAEEYSKKSDEELLKEIMRLKTAIQKDRKAYEQQILALKALSQNMNGKQKARLNKLIELLGI